MGFFDGWSFRTNTPTFSEGETLTLFTTGYDQDNQKLLANVGDTQLSIDEPDPHLVDRKVTIKITSFDRTSHKGEADLIEVEPTASF
jgi:hypothetical protein